MLDDSSLPDEVYSIVKTVKKWIFKIYIWGIKGKRG